MIEQYIYAVTKKLPEKSRNQIASELRALIENKKKEMGEHLSEEEKDYEVLLALGSPGEVAKRYKAKEKYLIGPAYFESYLFVLKIVVFAIFIGVTVTAGLSILFSVESFADAIGQYVGSLISAILQGAAWVTGIFAFLEYREIAIDIGMDKKNWDPSKLPVLAREKARRGKSETVFSIVFTALFLILFVFKPELVGIYYKIGDESDFINLFQLEAYKPFKIIIFLIFALSILGDFIKFGKGRWTIKKAVAVMMLNILSAALSIFILTKDQIWNPEMVAAFQNYDLFSFDRLIYLIMASIILIMIVESAIGLYKAIKYKAS